jgi:exodeoxyribonuclease-3
MKFVSWNVNGIRAVLTRGFAEFVRECAPDVLCLQETKAQGADVPLALAGYHAHWCSGERKGYAGVAAFTRVKPVRVIQGMGVPEHDAEGRVLTLEYRPYYLVNVYTPNSQRGLTRLDYRVKQWDPAFRAFLKRLEATKPVIFCGNLNVAHTELDIARPKANRRNAGFTDEERESFTRLLEAGFVDTFREFVTEGGHYSWWSYIGKAREKNVGWRIDYVCISKALRPRLKSAGILPEVRGSDHCPVTMELR